VFSPNMYRDACKNLSNSLDEFQRQVNLRFEAIEQSLFGYSLADRPTIVEFPIEVDKTNRKKEEESEMNDNLPSTSGCVNTRKRRNVVWSDSEDGDDDEEKKSSEVSSGEESSSSKEGGNISLEDVSSETTTVSIKSVESIRSRDGRIRYRFRSEKKT